MNNLNPLMTPQQQMMPNYLNYNTMNMLPRYEINIVKGAAGASNFRMAPNSRTILADETAPIVWFARTDSGGYLTVEPYDISPHQEQQPVNVSDLEARVRKLEEMYAQQSNSTKSRKQRQPAANAMVESANGAAQVDSTNV